MLVTLLLSTCGLEIPDMRRSLLLPPKKERNRAMSKPKKKSEQSATPSSNTQDAMPRQISEIEASEKQATPAVQSRLKLVSPNRPLADEKKAE